MSTQTKKAKETKLITARGLADKAGVSKETTSQRI